MREAKTGRRRSLVEPFANARRTTCPVKVATLLQSCSVGPPNRSIDQLFCFGAEAETYSRPQIWRSTAANRCAVTSTPNLAA
ncbi:MAG TPA: hypothetical protein VNT52_14535, partial [Acidimicrobiales bacterium]|nr:hypothetical protein [Acidimicrobiales bacterium]